MNSTKTKSYSNLVKQLPKATAFLNSNFELVHVSDQWIRDFEFDDRDIIGKTVFDLFDNVGENWGAILEDCLLGLKHTGQKHFVTSNAEEKWFEWVNAPWFDEKENVIGIIIQAEDITQRVQNELQFEKMETLLKAKAEIARLGSWEYNLVTGELTWCEMTKKIHEVPNDFEPDIDTAIEFYKAGHSRNTISMLVHNAIENGIGFNEKLEIVTYTGSTKWVVAGGKAIFNSGKAVRLIGTFQDIDEQVKSEIKTKDNERLLHTLVDNLPLNVFVKDKESRKLLVNKSECEYLGVKDRSSLIGKTDFDIFDEHVAQISRDEDVEVMKTLKPMIGRETVNIKKDGTATTFLTSKIPLLDTNGDAYGIIGLSMDITSLKEKENQLRDLINVTAIQNKKLINFAHIVSHNLRSHTSNFSMLLKFLVDEKDQKEKQRIIEMLTNASDNLMVTLDDLNQVVDINTNVGIEKKSLSLNGQLVKVQQNLSAFLEDNNAKIENKVSDKIKVKVVPSYLDSILLNLITNAVKYKHPQRKPQIKISVTKQKNFTILSVADNGLGIDMEKHGEKLFGMYKTFHNNKDSRGIGLYITKNQIEAMDGKIKVESQVNKGTTFKVYFNDQTNK